MRSFVAFVVWYPTDTAGKKSVERNGCAGLSAAPGACRRETSVTMSRRRAIAARIASASAWPECRAKGIHCSTALASPAISVKPAVRELLASVCGGSLLYDIATDEPRAMPHRLAEVDGRHGLRVETGTRLHALLGAATLRGS